MADRFVGIADPAYWLAVAIIFNGTLRDDAQRMRATLDLQMKSASG